MQVDDSIVGHDPAGLRSRKEDGYGGRCILPTPPLPPLSEHNSSQGISPWLLCALPPLRVDNTKCLDPVMPVGDRRLELIGSRGLPSD